MHGAKIKKNTTNICFYL